MGIFVWYDIFDKTEQPWEAPSREEAFAEVNRLRALGAKNPGFWDTSEPWPFSEPDETLFVGYSYTF